MAISFVPVVSAVAVHSAVADVNAANGLLSVPPVICGLCFVGVMLFLAPLLLLTIPLASPQLLAPLM